jgi:hypothetical protein
VSITSSHCGNILAKGVIIVEHSENSLLIAKVKLCKIGDIILESEKQIRVLQ